MKTFTKTIYKTEPIYSEDAETKEQVVTGSQYELALNGDRIPTGETEEVPLERWAWGVIYHPTAAQIENARVAMQKRTREINAEIIKLAKDYDATKLEFVRKQINKQIESLKVEKEVGIEPECEMLFQFDNRDGQFHSFDEIEQDRVKLFSLYNTKEPTRRIDIPVAEGMKLIHFYRNVKPYYLDNFVRCYAIGYKYKGAKNFSIVLPNNTIVNTPNDNIDLTTFNLK